MISTESFSKEWIDAGAPLTFKGGSSILLLLKDNLPRKIQKLRKGRPEAFYYWSKVAEMAELK